MAPNSQSILEGAKLESFFSSAIYRVVINFVFTVAIADINVTAIITVAITSIITATVITITTVITAITTIIITSITNSINMLTVTGRLILMSTDLTLLPLELIACYGYRIKIEVAFKQALYTIGTYTYHFWMMTMSPSSRRSGNHSTCIVRPKSTVSRCGEN